MAVNQQQLDYLGAMGIPVWISRGLPMPDVQEAALDTKSIDKGFSAELLTQSLDESPEQRVSAVTPSVSQAAVPAKKGMQGADELIKDLQQAPTKKIAELAASLDEVAKVEAPIIIKDLDGVDWVALEQAVNQCKACDLHEKRQHPVFGHGSGESGLMIVGDIPRLLDEQQQRPFAGETGELLDNLLSHLDISKDNVYFTNLLKCRPPLDNSPQANQAASCLSYLKQQIKLLRPQLVVLMGRSTAQQVLGQEQSMAQMRQKRHQIEGFEATQFIATYHPAYLLKQPRLKALVWQDLQFVKQALSH